MHHRAFVSRWQSSGSSGSICPPAPDKTDRKPGMTKASELKRSDVLSDNGNQLVVRAGSTMHEVVAAIGRVNDIMGEISAASHEQSLGVAQVGEAVTLMDQVSLQNAALVEEMAAAASSLQNQADDLVQVVSVFQLGGEAASRGNALGFNYPSLQIR